MGGRDAERAVAVVGAHGRFGSFASDLLRRTPGWRVAAEIERGDDLEASLRRSGAELGLDLTVAGLGCEHGLAMLACGLRPVIGTSGVSLEENARLDAAAREAGLGGLVVPNFCLGLVLLQRAALEAVRWMPAVEIVEAHGPHKVDAPSGTARDTAERLEAARGGAHGPVPIHSLRLPGVVARHEVCFGAEREQLSIRHEALGPEAFGPGLLLALEHAATARGVGRGLELALEEVPSED